MNTLLLKELKWEETEFARIPKEWYDKLQKLQSYEEQEAFFFKALEDKRTDVKYEIERMEENLLMFKAFGVRYKNELEKIYNEQLEILEQLWDKSDLGNILSKKVSEITSIIKPLINDVKELHGQLESVNTYRIDNLIETMNQYDRLSPDQKKLLLIMIENKEK